MRSIRSWIIVFTQLALVSSLFIAPVPVETEAQAASMFISPSSGSPGSTAQVSGSGYSPFEIIFIVFNGQVITSTNAGGTGNFLTGFIVPSLPPGTYAVNAHGQTSNQIAQQSFTIGVAQQPTQVFFQPTQQPTHTMQTIPFQPTQLVTSASCMTQNASIVPSTVPQGSRASYSAQGFQPFTDVTLQIIGPSNTPPMTVRVSPSCQISAQFQIDLFDPVGQYMVNASGVSYGAGPLQGQPLTLTTPFTVVGGAATPTPTPVGQPSTGTVTTTCPFPTAFISSLSVTAGQAITFGGQGFRPGAMVDVRFEDPTGTFEVPWFLTGQIGPATQTCSVSSIFTINQNVPGGRYRMRLSGPNHLGAQVTALQEFEVLPGQVPTVGLATPIGLEPIIPLPPPGGPIVPLIPIPPGVPGQPGVAPPAVQGPPAPIALDQTLTAIGGSIVPTVSQNTTYELVTRIQNTSAQALDFSVASAPGAGLLYAFSQGQSLAVTFETEFSADSRVVSATSNVGTASVRGTTVAWNGQLAAGQTVEIRTQVDHTPTTALALNQPIRGQSISVRDERGQTLSIPANALPRIPQLPPAQRIVQPPPPPVDPTTASRFFTETGFSIVNDPIWIYYNRRGGYRTFGPPISREFTLMGSQVQLFERALLQVNEQEQVLVLNLLEAPYLPYDALGDLQLPPLEEGVIAAAPDPAAPTFFDASQEFVRVIAAESYDEAPTRFYSTFLTTVLFRDAFFDGNGDPNLVPGFALEIWGLPTSGPSYHIVGYEPGEDETLVPIYDQNVVMQRFQKGVMRFEQLNNRRTAGVPLGIYLRALIRAEALPDLAIAASESGDPLFAQYNPDAVNWIDRPDELPDSNLVLAFEPE